jgi:serine/threonine protein kinase
MTEIHNAGVRHYDIRPENLMMDDEGNATIIDFDMAKVRAGKRSRRREFEHLCDLLDGGYDPPNQWPSPRTSAGPPPTDDEILEGRI